MSDTTATDQVPAQLKSTRQAVSTSITPASAPPGRRVGAEPISAEPISALELARRLNYEFPPTPQQIAVIEAPLTPALVVAGAGSGKTETMANRVLWLLANGYVDINQVLGLTFTRKAAGELGERIGQRIHQLEEAGLLPTGANGIDAFEQPTVSTYNAFANGIFRDNALLVGREPESALLNDTSAWRLARRVVTEFGDERLAALGKSVDAVTEAVLELSRELSENEVNAAELCNLVADFGYLAELPYTDGKAKKAPYASVVNALADVAPLPMLVELVGKYTSEKKRQGLVEYSDQVALALAVCNRVPAVAARYREQYRVVLLDEYQDTSVVQTRLLSTLFTRQGVMAVGDPHQSIYGWRGASEANLNAFFHDFGATEDSQRFALSTSWRNANAVLEVANRIVKPLIASSRTSVEPLGPRPGAPAGEIDTYFAETIGEEAACVAEWLEAQLTQDGASSGSAKKGNAKKGSAEKGGTEKGGAAPSAAILFRARQHMSLFAEALAARGMKYHILGIGGLLSTPEIVDVTCALRVIHDPYAGASLIRLLAGGRWRIGVRDLQALSDVAGWLHTRDWKQAALTDEVQKRMRESVSIDDGRSLVDALDFVSEAPIGHRRLEAFSELGFDRLRDAGHALAVLRSRSGLGLLDLVRLIEQELLLDIEVVANGSGSGLANLHAFHDEIAGFLAADDNGSLGSFLSWLARAERQDNFGPRSEAAEPGTVQLLTIHGAKGLEWDAVAVPRLVADELPGQSKEGAGWLRFGKLPFELRLDGAELPQIDWRFLQAQNQFDMGLKQFKLDLAERHHAEERRLAYVAVTRARNSLLLTGSFWSKPAKSRSASVFLTELADCGLIPELPQTSRHEENPLVGNELTAEWPIDPLGSRRSQVETAARAVLTAEPDGSRWERDIDLLLAEREARRSASELVALPTRIPASRFKDFVTQPSDVAASLRRPMPERPYRQTRLGTLFHSWVEERSTGRGSIDVIDASFAELDELDELDELGELGALTHYADVETAELERLKKVFEVSEWGRRKPEFVEEEIHLPLAGQIIVCKIDAVYRKADSPDGRPRYQVVDWKTGKAPTSDKELELKQLQLALYRLAFAYAHKLDPEQIDAVFYYVSDDIVVAPKRLYSEADLSAAWSSATGSRPR